MQFCCNSGWTIDPKVDRSACGDSAAAESALCRSLASATSLNLKVLKRERSSPVAFNAAKVGRCWTTALGVGGSRESSADAERATSFAHSNSRPMAGRGMNCMGRVDQAESVNLDAGGIGTVRSPCTGTIRGGLCRQPFGPYKLITRHERPSVFLRGTRSGNCQLRVPNSPVVLRRASIPKHQVAGRPPRQRFLHPEMGHADRTVDSTMRNDLKEQFGWDRF